MQKNEDQNKNESNQVVFTPNASTLTTIEQNEKLFSDNVLTSNEQSSPFGTIYKNVDLCVQLGQQLKSLLGPRSRDKLLVSFDDEISVTNDGATVLKSLNTSSPVVKILAQLGLSMDNESGDGTTSVVVFASALLKHAKNLMQQNSIHPQIIISGYNSGLKLVKQFLEESKGLKREIDPYDTQYSTLLQNISITSLNSKISSIISPTLADIAVKAIVRTKGSEKKVRVIQGGVDSDYSFSGGTSSHDTYLLPGNSILVKSRSYLNQPIDLHNCKIAVLTFELDLPRTGSHQMKINVQSLSQIDRLLKEEQTYVKKIIANLKRIGAQCVCIQQSILSAEGSVSETAKLWLNKSKIVALKPLANEEVSLMLDFLNIVPISTPEQLNDLATSKDKILIDKYVRSMKHVYDHAIGEQKYVVFSADDDSSKSYATVVLRAPSQIAIEELDRALHDALRVLETLFQKPIIVPGGGSCEIAVRTYLELVLNGELTERSFVLSSLLTKSEKSAVHAFVQALEEVPLVLCSNASLSPVSTINQLKKKQREILLKSNDAEDIGIFIPKDSDQKSGISNMFTTGVVEPMSSKLAQWEMATQAAIQILKIDGVFVASR